ncbi:hypothetical protein K490DRAFT_59792 [Saccharata proteae CBS 121410]|uniref:SWIM-type domain-containing protein n=1 Tax=Saccharata proteae CBS 121410 TaxID=1314787 RepID=A0A9P4LVL1_9PEZI|nr:hypothetical protein K490DRAFT_59792 [Saccharata proteae CBS 121410]
MSAPTSAFQNLSLGQDDFIPDTIQNDPDEDREESLVTYNVADLPQTARKRVRAGVGADTTVDNVNWCMEKEDEDGDLHYHFDMKDNISVKFGRSQGSKYAVPKCSCGATEQGNACKHVFWLENQVVQATGHPPNALKLVADGRTIHGRTVPDLITSLADEGAPAAGLRDLADVHDWVLRPQSAAEEDFEEQLQDLISVFEPNNALPEELWREDFARGLGKNSPSRVYKEFAEIVTTYAQKDYSLQHRLQETITPEFRALVFFKKLQDRQAQVFQALEEYKKHAPEVSSIPAHDVATCAEKLQQIVAQLKEGYEDRVKGKLENSQAASFGAGVLIEILRKVVERNKNAYEGISWNRIEDLSETAQDNNLYVRLIGSPVNTRGPFLLQALKNVPRGALDQFDHRESLVDIKRKLESYNAPQAYVMLLGEITRDGGSPGRKRPLAAESGSSKKR